MNTKTQFIKKFLVPACFLLLAGFVLAGGAPAGAVATDDASDKPAAGGEQAASAEKKSDKPVYVKEMWVKEIDDVGNGR